jgi:magnesium-transporting ATPase (P-type)
VNFIDENLDKDLIELKFTNNSSQRDLTDPDNNLELYLVFLSLCHTIIIDARSGKFNASSPDELALVNAAKQFGYEFVGKDGDEVCTVR